MKEELSDDVMQNNQMKYLLSHFKYADRKSWTGCEFRVSNKFKDGVEYLLRNHIIFPDKIVVKEKEDYYFLKGFGETFGYNILVRDWEGATLDEIVPMLPDFDTPKQLYQTSRTKKATELLSIEEVSERNGM